MLYRWDQSSILYEISPHTNIYYQFDRVGSLYTYAGFNSNTGTFYAGQNLGNTYGPGTRDLVDTGTPQYYYHTTTGYDASNPPTVTTYDGGYFTRYQSRAKGGSLIGYVYSSNESAYPNGGASGNYWYVKTPHNYSMKVRRC